MSDINLTTFPTNSDEALAMLYLNNSNLSEATPEVYARIYYDALEKIKQERISIRKEQRERQQLKR